MTVPDGAQLSEDGKYWWDGSDWQPVPEDGGGSTEVGQLSEDGKWKWDGSQWQPADEEGGDGLHEALSSQGIDIAPENADAGYVQQMYDHLSDWYDSLDDVSKAVVDALSQEGADTLLADPTVGVVNADDPLVTAFAATDKTLGESLQATGEALEQASA
ncbi:hypothetical protein [Actinophytocola oryzae]|uniref:Uncharacterized protein n=1 Tax=Actinophytocola oryzae TaxID=502181 RepID=A0A4R7UWF4_9PSEU|nr:hypothetical protein [Actinophytocola oryzae]TDV40387.1 hypothetical protein CLV71_12397 [Actinophytocola oryzae]